MCVCDDIAQIMRRQALSRLSVHIEAVPEPKFEVFERIENLLRLTAFVGMVLSFLCILTGAFNPAARNLIGLGVAFLCLSIALYIFRRR